MLRIGLQEDATNVGNSAISLCADFGFTEHEAAIRAAYHRGLVDPFYESLDGAIARLRGETGESFVSEYQLVTDAVGDMSCWACFSEEAGTDTMEREDKYDAKEIFAAPTPRTEPHSTVRLPPKVGRNDPCPCGSGKISPASRPQNCR